MKSLAKWQEINNLKSLEDYATTDRQREVLKTWEECNRNSVQASGSLGITSSTVRDIINTIKSKAAAAGYSEHWDARRHVPAGEHVIGRSIYTEDDEGNRAWLKTKRTIEQAEKEKAFKAFIEELNSNLKKANKTRKQKKIRASDIMPTITIGDAHIGMRADGSETRDRDFDSKIAAKEILAAVDDLTDKMPEAKVGMLVQVGDFTHSDGSSPFTTQGTLVDVDTRFEKIMRTAANVMVHAIDRMLDKCDTVQVVVARGNHDTDAALAVQLILEFYYSNEPRINILKSKGFFHYLQWGKWLFGIHHGDKVKAAKLAQIMPRDMPNAWGATTHRMWFVGHFHHASIQEFEGVTVQKFGTLAPPDAWHSGQGYGSDHTMSMIVFKKDGGKLITCTYEIPKQYSEPDVVI